MMTHTQSSDLSAVDADAVLSRVQATAGDHLRAFVEYDAETYDILYLTDRAIAEFGGEERVDEFADRLYSNYRLDFNEKQMHEDLYEEFGVVRAFGVFFADSAVLRFVDDVTGLYVSLDMDAPFDEVIDTVYEVVEG